MLVRTIGPLMRRSGHANDEYARKPSATGAIPHKNPVASPTAAKRPCAMAEAATNAKNSPMNLAWPMRRSMMASGI